MHLLGYCKVYALDLCGPSYSTEPITFATKMKKGAPRKTNRYGVVNKKNN